MRAHADPNEAESILVHIGPAGKVVDRPQDVPLLLQAEGARSAAFSMPAEVEEEEVVAGLAQWNGRVQQVGAVFPEVVAEDQRAARPLARDEPSRQRRAVNTREGDLLVGDQHRSRIDRLDTALGVHELTEPESRQGAAEECKSRKQGQGAPQPAGEPAEEGSGTIHRIESRSSSRTPQTGPQGDPTAGPFILPAGVVPLPVPTGASPRPSPPGGRTGPGPRPARQRSTLPPSRTCSAACGP